MEARAAKLRATVEALARAPEKPEAPRPPAALPRPPAALPGSLMSLNMPNDRHLQDIPPEGFDNKYSAYCALLVQQLDKARNAFAAAAQENRALKQKLETAASSSATLPAPTPKVADAASAQSDDTRQEPSASAEERPSSLDDGAAAALLFLGSPKQTLPTRSLTNSASLVTSSSSSAPSGSAPAAPSMATPAVKHATPSLLPTLSQYVGRNSAAAAASRPASSSVASIPFAGLKDTAASPAAPHPADIPFKGLVYDPRPTSAPHGMPSCAYHRPPTSAALSRHGSSPLSSPYLSHSSSFTSVGTDSNADELLSYLLQSPQLHLMSPHARWTLQKDLEQREGASVLASATSQQLTSQQLTTAQQLLQRVATERGLSAMRGRSASWTGRAKV